MKTLKEYILEQAMTGETDMELITRFLTSEDLEEKALLIIPTLANSKIEKLNNRINIFTTWAPYITGIKRMNGRKGKITEEVGHNLDRISLMGLCDYELDRTDLYEWAKENIPKMKMPFFFFRPTSDYLAKYGIHFMEEKTDETKN